MDSDDSDSPVEVGHSAMETFVVTDEMSPPHLPVKVLSTPDMVKLIEGVCLGSVQPLLGEGETTVGIHICVSHQAAAASGDEVVVTGTVSEVDRKRLGFEVSVMKGDVIISEGTHQRFVVGG